MFKKVRSLASDENCIFCKIIKGDIPCKKVYEDNKFFAFLDIAPSNIGHTLVIPKEHHETLMDLPEPILKEVLGVVKKVAQAVSKATQAQGFNVMMNNYEAAGQLVFHSHLHIIPRFKGDGLKPWGKKEGISEEDIKAVYEEIVSFI